MSNIQAKVDVAIRRLQNFEPEEGYYLAFSGGKDSQCIYYLAKQADVKFDAHYHVTSVDPPELVKFIKEQYPDVSRDIPRDKNGNAITMWSLIGEHTIPPTRIARYCCKDLKETGGKGRIVVTGVRWSESANRKNNHGVVDFQRKPITTKKIADESGVDYKLDKRGSVILNDDNDESRRMVEQCFRTNKTIVNPIVDWEEEDVWEYLNDVVQVPHCCLYDEGFKRLGCVGCPLGGRKFMLAEFERWPKYKSMYIRAFQKMIDNHPGQMKVLQPYHNGEYEPDADTTELEEDVKKRGGQRKFSNGEIISPARNGERDVCLVDVDAPRDNKQAREEPFKYLWTDGHQVMNWWLDN